MAQRELTSADYMAMLRRRWILVAVMAFIGSPVAYGLSRFIRNQYKSTTLVLVERPSVPTDFVKPVDTTDVNERLATMQQQILSHSRLEPIIRQYGLYANDINRVSMDELVARLQAGIQVTPVEPMALTRASNLPGFFVNVTMDNPRTAQQVCTAVTSLFIEEELRLRQEHSQDTTQFLAQQMEVAKTNLDDQDSKLAAFKSRYIGSLPDEEQTNLNLLTGLTSQLDATTEALSRAQQDKSFASSLLAQQVASAQATQSGNNPETQDQQLSILQAQVAALQARYTDDYPDVIKAKNEVAALQKRIAENAQQNPAPDPAATPKPTLDSPQISQLKAQVRSYDQIISEKTKEQEKIKQQIGVYQSRVQSSPAVEQQYKELTRGYQTALDSYNELQKKRDESAMATALEHKQEGENFTVLDPANLPDKPSYPNRPLFAFEGLAGGLALGLGLAIVMEMQNTSLRGEKDVEFALRLPVLAMIPAIDPASGKKPRQAGNGTLPADSGLTSGARA